MHSVINGVINGKASTKHRKNTQKSLIVMAFCVFTSLVQELTLILELEVHTYNVIHFSKIIRQKILLCREHYKGVLQQSCLHCYILMQPFLSYHFYSFPSVLQLQSCMQKYCIRNSGFAPLL